MNGESINLKPVKDNFVTNSDDQRLYDVVAKVVQPDGGMTPAEAAELINQQLLARKSDQNDDSDVSGAEGFLWNFWELLIQIVQLVPHDHRGQIKLMLTMEELRLLPATTMEIWGAETCLWTDLPLLGPCMRDSWDPPTYNGKIPDDESVQKWINLTTFAARLFDKGFAQWTNFAIWALRAALEQPTSAGRTMNCDVMTATEWIFQGGEALFKRLNEDALTEDETRSMRNGVLYRGKSGLCRERWEFWKLRFFEVSEELNGNIRERAISAAEKMENIGQLAAEQEP